MNKIDIVRKWFLENKNGDISIKELSNKTGFTLLFCTKTLSTMASRNEINLSFKEAGRQYYCFNNVKIKDKTIIERAVDVVNSNPLKFTFTRDSLSNILNCGSKSINDFLSQSVDAGFINIISTGKTHQYQVIKRFKYPIKFIKKKMKISFIDEFIYGGNKQRMSANND